MSRATGAYMATSLPSAGTQRPVRSDGPPSMHADPSTRNRFSRGDPRSGRVETKIYIDQAAAAPTACGRSSSMVCVARTLASSAGSNVATTSASPSSGALARGRPSGS